MKVYCKFCGSVIAQVKSELTENIVKCSSCNNIFAIFIEEGVVSLVTRKQAGARKIRREHFNKPAGLKVMKDERSLRIVLSQSKGAGFTYGIISLFFGWLGGVTLYYAIFYGETINYIPGAAFFLVILLYLYYAFKRVEVTVTRREIKTRKSPLPFNSDYDVDPPLSFYVKRCTPFVSFGSRRGQRFAVRMRDGEGYDLIIVKGLRSEPVADYFKQEIELFLVDYIL